MTITREDVLAIARLSRLRLDEDAADKMSGEMDKILSYVSKLDELDTKDVPPTAQVAVDVTPLRDDEVVPSIDKRQVLGAAPRSDDAGFLVPAFVDES